MWLQAAEWAAKTVVFGAKAARKLHGQHVVSRVRDRAAIGLVGDMHSAVIHNMRTLSMQMTEWDTDAASLTAMHVCTECRRVLCNLLELKANQLHCCLKMIAPKSRSDDEDRVATWARSEPFDDRPFEQGEENAHLVSRNSVWSALMGRTDGRTYWRPFSCFACNDLCKHRDLFQCDRENWSRYYQSTLVFPLRYVKNTEATVFENIGFLAFDSPKTGAFLEFPDILDYRDQLAEYQDRLQERSAFHIGALFADTLSTFLRTVYEQTLSREQP